MNWTRIIRCAGGMKCADVIATNTDDVPPGATIRIEYTCGTCGTIYAWDSKTRKRKVIKELTQNASSLEMTIAPGERKSVEVNIPGGTRPWRPTEI